eukprot:g49349.t1
MGNNSSVNREGSKITNHYILKEKLGQGNFAIVRRGIRKSDQKEFAIKMIMKKRLRPEEMQATHDEVEIMQRIDHPHCVKLYEMFHTKKELYMVMELLTGGELFDRIVEKKSFSEQKAVRIVKSIADALAYLHRNGITHRDLKPENLLLADMSDDAAVKITDFGFAKFRVNADVDMITACGTPGYVAPEVLEGKPYGPAVDVWSLGVIMYILLCGFPPFFHPKTEKLYKLIKSGRFDFPAEYFSMVTQNAKNLICKCLVVDPQKRITAEEILSDPWIVGKAATRDLGATVIENIRVLQCKQRLRRTVQAIIALIKFKHALDDLMGFEETPPTTT